MHHETSLNGIKGWLILTVISLVITPIISLLYILFGLTTYFEHNYWYYFTTYGTELYHPLFAPMIFYELVINTAFIFIPIFLLFLMFKRSPHFPKAMIIYLSAGIVLHFIDVYLVYSVFSNFADIEGISVELESLLARDSFRIVLGAMIWIPYFVYSKRVEVTFLSSKTNEASEATIVNEQNLTNGLDSQVNQLANKKSRLPIFSYSVNFLLVIIIFFIWFSNDSERKILEHSNSVLGEENTALEESYLVIKEEISVLEEKNTQLQSELDEIMAKQNSSSFYPAKEENASPTDFIDIGSTKEDVRRVMGTPSTITENSISSYWKYGWSRIDFDRDGKVKGWNNYDNNLKLK